MKLILSINKFFNKGRVLRFFLPAYITYISLGLGYIISWISVIIIILTFMIYEYFFNKKEDESNLLFVLFGIILSLLIYIIIIWS